MTTPTNEEILRVAEQHYADIGKQDTVSFDTGDFIAFTKAIRKQALEDAALKVLQSSTKHIAKIYAASIREMKS